MLCFGVLIAATGMTGLFNPEFLLHVLGLSGAGTTRLFLMASSQASLAMGMYYILATIHNNRVFYRWSVGVRIMNFVVFTSMVLLDFAPVQWLLVAGLEIAGALATGIALASHRNLSVDRFNTLRITSILLALVGGLVVLQPFGIYGSASVFLVVSTAGFIYAYRMFAPGQA